MSNHKNYFIKIGALLLAGVMIISQPVYAVFSTSGNETKSTKATENNGTIEGTSGKEEVVYAMLDSEGNVTGLYVVNIFTGKSKIIDYGDYTSVKNLTTTDEITFDGSRVMINTNAEKLYYQGNLASKDLPWNIKIHYYLDGKEKNASEIAGKSGSLVIKIDITENKNCDSSYFEGYALQITMAFDSANCKNIVSDGATIANVGSDKQLSYIILPNKGENIEISADVTNFEMDAISINGVKLNLNMDIDTSELNDKVNEINDAVKKLNIGADKLNTGAGALRDGSKNLYDGSVTLNAGASDLSDGMLQLQTGINKVYDGLNTLNGKSSSLTEGSGEVLTALKTIQASLSSVNMNAEDIARLTEASTEIKSGIDALVNGLSTMSEGIDGYNSTIKSYLNGAGIADVNGLANKNVQAARTLEITSTQRALYKAYTSGGDSSAIAKLKELVASGDKEASALFEAYTGGDTACISEYIEKAGLYIQIESLLLANSLYITGSNTLISRIDEQLDSSKGELMKGALTLQSSYAEFNTAIQELGSSLEVLTTNMAMLKAGIDTLVSNYSALDSGINEYTAAVGAICTGYKEIYNGAKTLTNGTSELYNGTKDLVDGTNSLYSGSVELGEGTGELKNGTEEFYDRTQGMDAEINEQIQATLDTLTGKDVPVVSFVSDKNEVSSVLFVIKIPAIEKTEVEESEAPQEEEKGFFEKLLALFGL